VFDKKGKFEKVDETKQNAEYTPKINTCVNIIKNKFDEVLAYEGRLEKNNVKTLNAECTPTINTTVNTVTRNPKNTIKKP
jgi:hypothetical protein